MWYVESLDVVRYLISIKEPSLTTSWKSLLVMRGMIRISTCNLWNDGRPLHSLKIVEVLHVKNLARVRIFCHYFFDLETSSFWNEGTVGIKIKVSNIRFWCVNFNFSRVWIFLYYYFDFETIGWSEVKGCFCNFFSYLLPFILVLGTCIYRKFLIIRFHA